MREGTPGLAPLIAVWLATACGGDASPPSNPSAGGNGAAGTAGLTGVSGAPVGASGAASGAAGTAATSDPAPLVPLIAGHVSHFAFKPIDSTKATIDTCDAPTAAVGEPGTIAAHTGIFYATPCGAAPYLIEGTGDQLTAHRVENGVIVSSYEYVHSPVIEGERWSTNGGDYEWRKITAKLEVPAGSFDDCWERWTDDSSLVYCRGVGLVRTTRTPDNYLLELIRKNF